MEEQLLLTTRKKREKIRTYFFMLHFVNSDAKKYIRLRRLQKKYNRLHKPYEVRDLIQHSLSFKENYEKAMEDFSGLENIKLQGSDLALLKDISNLFEEVFKRLVQSASALGSMMGMLTTKHPQLP